MAANRKGRLLVIAALAALALACNKGGEDRRATEAAAGSGRGGGTAPSESPAPGGDPHAGIDMGGAGGDPHAGVDMSGGGGADPHAGMDMSGGGKAAGVEVDKDGKSIVGPLLLAVPKGWKNQPASGMRAAQWTIPGAKGAKDATLVVYFFGAGGAGSVEDNLTRWYSQFQPEGDKPITPKTEKKQVAGMAVTLTEVEGRYVASTTPGSAEKNDEPGWMMMAAIMETPAGAYYFKLTGPKATAGAARKDFRAAIDTAQLKK